MFLSVFKPIQILTFYVPFLSTSFTIFLACLSVSCMPSRVEALRNSVQDSLLSLLISIILNAFRHSVDKKIYLKL